MQAGEKKKKTWDPSRFRKEYMTYWQRSHPVMIQHLHTDHWSKMKTMAQVCYASVPAAGERPQHYMTPSSVLPPLTQVEALINAPGLHSAAPRASPQNMPQYRNVYNDRARRDFCYWLSEKKGSTCKGKSFGAYKTCLGLPKI